MLDTKTMVRELQDMREDGYLSDALLRYAVRSLKGADERFDWVGAYLVGSEGNEIWLHNYVGPRTEHAKIAVGEGVTGSAVAEKANQNVADVTEYQAYISGDSSISSEMVVLIRAGDDVFGLIDLESMEPAAFTPEDETAIGMVADKLAEQFMAERR